MLGRKNKFSLGESSERGQNSGYLPTNWKNSAQKRSLPIYRLQYEDVEFRKQKKTFFPLATLVYIVINYAQTSVKDSKLSNLILQWFIKWLPVSVLWRSLPELVRSIQTNIDFCIKKVAAS